METIAYLFKSNPGNFIPVPKEFSITAANLVKDALEFGKSKTVSDLADGYPCLSNVGILHNVTRLINSTKGTPESLKIQDVVYLRVCIVGMERGRSKNNYDREYEEFIVSLIEAVGRL
jgi:hypothetical protein